LDERSGHTTVCLHASLASKFNCPNPLVSKLLSEFLGGTPIAYSLVGLFDVRSLHFYNFPRKHVSKKGLKDHVEKIGEPAKAKLVMFITYYNLMEGTNHIHIAMSNKEYMLLKEQYHDNAI
jgi:hypothetical protein